MNPRLLLAPITPQLITSPSTYSSSRLIHASFTTDLTVSTTPLAFVSTSFANSPADDGIRELSPPPLEAFWLRRYMTILLTWVTPTQPRKKFTAASLFFVLEEGKDG